MILETKTPAELDWRLDFSPREDWPEPLPIMAVNVGGPLQVPLQVVAGFDRQTQAQCRILVLDDSAENILRRLHKNLGAFENLRLEKVLSGKNNDLLHWPIDFQNYCDDHKLSLKMLKPLTFLTPWLDVLVKNTLALRPSASQLREILDLACDLNLSGVPPSVFPQVTDSPSLIRELKKLRFPQTLAGDALSAQNLLKVSWPKGVHARWERHGDTAGVVLQTKVSTPREWNQLKESIKNLQVPEDVWKN